MIPASDPSPHPHLISHQQHRLGTIRAAHRVARVAIPDLDRTAVDVCTRRHRPGIKRWAVKVIEAGGASPHRLRLPDSILMFHEHWTLIGPGRSEAEYIAYLRAIDHIAENPARLPSRAISRFDQSLRHFSRISLVARIIRQFGWFAVVGAGGFLVDTGITMWLAGLGWGPEGARVPGLTLAILFTWAANRRLTFGRIDQGRPRELLRYAGVALTVALINYSVYLLLVGPLGSIMMAIILATAVSMLASFAGYRLLVFGR